MVALRAYFDASGKESNPVLTVGGFIGTDTACVALERKWKTAMNGKGPFHLTDFGTEWCKLGSGSWTTPQRVDFIKKLGSFLHTPDIRIVSLSVESSEYNSFVAKSQHEHVYGPAYSFCSQSVFSLCELHVDKTRLQDQHVAYVFETGDRQHELSRSFQEYVKNNRLKDRRSISFEPKSTPLLQPTDLIAGKVQEILERAYDALHCLDNGMDMTPVINFEKYYSRDGTSAAVLKGGRLPLSFVLNRKFLARSEHDISEAFRANPDLLTKRMKQTLNQGKRSRQ